MLSSGLASSTMKSALLPAATAAELVEPQHLRRIARAGEDRLHRRQPAARDQQLQLDMRAEAEILAAGDAARIGAEHEARARRFQLGDIAQIRRPLRPRDWRFRACAKDSPSSRISSGEKVSRRIGSSTQAGFDV